jgi:transglutaminase-like putative cysteine protease
VRLTITHRTAFRYPAPVREAHTEVRMQPGSDAGQTLLAFELVARPAAAVHRYEASGGVVHHFAVRGPTSELEVTATFTVETHRTDALTLLDPRRDDLRVYRDPHLRQEHAEWLAHPVPVEDPGPLHALGQEAADRAAGPGATAFLRSLCELLHARFAFDPFATTVDTPLADVLAMRRGVCQDFAGVFLAVCRERRIPARYVSGYLYPGRGDDDLVGGGAGHAWAECLLPDGRWAGLDPTNGVVAGDRHVRVHVGRSYADAPPTRGVYFGPQADGMEVSVDVRPWRGPTRGSTRADVGPGAAAALG